MLIDTDITFKWNKEKIKFEVEKGSFRLVASSDKDINLLDRLPYTDKRTLKIEKKFYTDFGSIPLFAKPFFNPIGKEVPAYLLHDYLCVESARGKLDRKVADDILLYSLLSLGTSKYRAYIIYYFCRLKSKYKEFRK